MKLGEAQSIMVMKSPARDGSLAVLQLAMAPRDDEASGVAFLLCLTRMDLWKSSLLLGVVSPMISCVSLGEGSLNNLRTP